MKYARLPLGVALVLLAALFVAQAVSWDNAGVSAHVGSNGSTSELADARTLPQVLNGTAWAVTVEGVCRDLNADSDVDVFDAILILQIIVGLVIPDETQGILADLNRDRKIDVFDAITVLQVIVGLTIVDSCGPALVVDLVASSDSGDSDSDDVTNDATPTMTVEAEPGSLVRLFVDDRLVGEATTTPGGLAEFTTGPLIDGIHVFTAEADDQSGFVLTADPLEIVIDTAAPSALELEPLFPPPVSFFDVFYTDVMGDSAFLPESYALTIEGGPNDGQAVSIAAVAPLDTSTARIDMGVPLDDSASYLLAIGPSVSDLAGNPLTDAKTFGFAVPESFRITAVSPANAEEMVSVTREAIIRFTEPVDPTTVTSETVQAIALGQQVSGRLVVSSTERFVTFFPDQPWPASTEVRIRIDGSGVLASDGDALDADGDGLAGGIATADFRTLPLTRIPGTDVFGFVFDSFDKNPDGSDRPIVGATIRVDAFPEANAVTDESGFFTLRDMPAPEFFVHVDGTTAINAPAGTVYPSVGKSFHSVPGQSTQVSMDGQPFNIYLPPMDLGDIQPLSATQDTDVGFGPAGKAELAGMFPNLDPATWDLMKVTFAPNAAVDEQGNPATEAVIIPVPPDRIPAPLPPGLNPQLVVSIQAGDATNFDVPAAVAFPNLEGLAPGGRSLIFSFNHDAGRWEAIGTGTVSEDGLAVLSDPGVGILAPGWHSPTPPRTDTSPPDPPCDALADEKVVTVTIEGALLGDIITADLSSTGLTNFGFSPLTGICSPGMFADPDPDLKGWEIARSDNWEARFHDTGLIYVVPFFPDTFARFTMPPVTVQLLVTGEKQDGERVFILVQYRDARPGYSPSTGPNPVLGECTGFTRCLYTYRQQQRLRWLGFPGFHNGVIAPLPVIGKLGPRTKWAIGLFNAAVQNTQHNPNSTKINNPYINAANAPVWGFTPPGGVGWINRDLPDPKPHSHGTSWAIQVINQAGMNNSSKPILTNDLSLPQGGDTPDHASHEAGMDIDVRIGPPPALWYKIGTVVANLNKDTTPATSDSFWDKVAEAVDSDALTDAATARTFLVQGTTGSTGNFTAIYCCSDSQVANGWRIDRTIIALYGHRAGGDDDAYAVAVRNMAPNPAAANAFDAGFDKLIPVSGSYDRQATVNHILAFNNLSVGRVIFNDPRAKAMVSAQPITFSLISLKAHGNHFHVDIKPFDVQANVQALGATSLAVGTTASISTEPGFGSDPRLYFRFELPTGFEVVGRSDADGRFRVFIQPDTDFTVTYYQASTNRSAVYQGHTASAFTFGGLRGARTVLPTIILDQFGGPDTDGDGIPDVGEHAIGTSATLADTDGDGISDAAEITQGLDPLDNRGFPTGIIASLPLLGESNEVVVEGTTAYVATGSHGLAIVDVGRFNNPIALGQLDLPGNAVDISIDPELDVVVVATQAGGLQLVDVSDPMLPTLRQTVELSADQVEVVDGVAYTAAGTTLHAIDLLTGLEVQKLTLPGSGTVTGMAREGTTLYAFVGGFPSGTFSVIDVAAEGSASVRGQLTVNGLTAADVFAANDIAYLTGDALRTIDVSIPVAPTLISGAPASLTLLGLALNGSGLALIADGQGVAIYDIKDPQNTNVVVFRINTPGSANQVAIASGIAFVADGPSGLQVINYLPFDNLGLPPTVGLSTSAEDVDPGTGGVQVLEGTTFPIQVDVLDDVQVRDVALLVNGELARTDVSFPWDFSPVALSDDPAAPAVTVQVRAIDTGGNTTLSGVLVLDLVPDTFAPTIVTISPPDGATAFQGLRQVTVRVSEPLAAGTVSATTFRLLDAQGSLVVPLNLQLRNDDRLVKLTYEPLPPGNYQLVIQAAAVTDRVGNPLGAADVTSAFTLAERGRRGGDYPLGRRRPQSLALGDLDGDGDLDMVAGGGRVSVLLGGGDGTFAPPTDYLPGSVTTGLALGDVNGDGHLDVLTLGGSLFLGVGDGTFGPRIDLGVSNTLALGDVNGDNILDIVALKTDFLAPAVSVLLGNGDGTFVSSVDSALPTTPSALAVGDLDGDGDLDVVTAHGVFSDTVSVLLGNGDGTFPPGLSHATGNNPSFVALGDLDGDGDLDIVTANQDGNTVSVLLGVGDGTFAATADYGVGDLYFGLDSVALGDLDGDGAVDIVTANRNGNSLTVLLGNGDGTFAGRADYGVEGSPVSIALGDVDGDGDLDFVYINEDTDSVSVRLSRGDGTIRNEWPSLFTDRIYSTFGFSDVTAADLDGDKHLDLVIAGAGVHVLFGRGDASFAPPVGQLVRFGAGGSLALGDLNGDGRLDIVSGEQCCSPNIWVLLSSDAGTFGPGTRLSIAGAPSDLALGDLDGDGRLDLVSAIGGNAVSVLLGAGDGTFGAEAVYAVGDFPVAVTLGDLDGDGDLEIVTANKLSDNVSVLFGNGDGTFPSRADISVDRRPEALALGDLDGDTDLDLVTANGVNTATVLLGDGNGTFPDRVEYGVSAGSRHAVALGDLDSDGDLDIAVGAFEGVSVLLGLGGGTFGDQAEYALGPDPRSLTLGDADGDGDLDLLVTDALPFAVWVILNRGDGTFVDRPEPDFPVPESPQDVIVADVNGDGRLDVVTTHPGTRTVGVLLGGGDGTFGPAGTNSVGLRPMMVDVGDLNGDGNPDLVTANLGTPSIPGKTVSILFGRGDGTFAIPVNVAVGECPRAVALGDVDGDGDLDIVTRNRLSVSVLLGQGDGTFPDRTDLDAGGGSCSGVADSISLSDVDGDEDLDIVHGNTGAFFSGLSVRLNQGDGTFPSRTDFQRQDGQINGPFVLGDVDNDGNLDVVTRLGWVVLGNGDGTFDVERAYRYPEGGATALGDLDLDGNLDLVMSSFLRNDVRSVKVLLGNGDGSFAGAIHYVTGTGPLALVLGDLDSDGDLDLLTANVRDNSISPRLNLTRLPP